jgi:type I restriction enzyme S subunit
MVLLSKIEIEKFAPATAQKNINLGIINNLYCPVPPLLELEEIVEKVNRILKLCDELDSQINKNILNAESLIRAVLKEEFLRN